MDREAITAVMDIELKELNDAQLEYIRESFNTYIRLEYGEAYGLHVFKFSEDGFRRAEHYLGFEYVSDEIDVKIQACGKVLVAYNYNERTAGLIEHLEELEEE